MKVQLLRFTSRNLSCNKVKVFSFILIIFLSLGALEEGSWRGLSSPIPLKIETYEVSGSSAKELIQSMRIHGPTDAAGFRRDALFSWDISWAWDLDPDGNPLFETLRTKCQGTLILPVRKQVLGQGTELDAVWEKFVAATRLHEDGHIDLFERHCQDIETAIQLEAKKNPALDARGANKVAQREVTKLRRLEESYDRQTDHGRKQGAELTFAQSPESPVGSFPF